MSIKNNIITGSWVFHENGAMNFDYDSFTKNILLFDKVILKTMSFREFKYIIDLFGYEGVKILFDSNIIKIFEFANAIGQRANKEKIYKKKLTDISIIGPFKFVLVSEMMSKREDSISNHFQKNIMTIENIGINRKKKLKNIILDSLMKVPKNFGHDQTDSFVNELESNSEIIKKTLIERVKTKFSKDLAPYDLILTIHQIAINIFEVQTNLEKFLQIETEELYDILQRAILDIVGGYRKLEEMNKLEGLTYFNDDDLFLFKEKYKSLISLCKDSTYNDQIDRVFTLKRFPKMTEFTRIDIGKFMKLRESEELKSFKYWLNEIKGKDDLEIVEEFESFKAKSSFIYSNPMFVPFKFLLSTIVGFAGLIPGVTLNAIDSFLLAKIFSKPGPASFLNKKYPSIFTEYRSGLLDED